MEITGNPSRVEIEYHLELPVAHIELRDDGADGDRKAGDRIYTLKLDPSSVIRSLRPDDVFSVFVGYGRLYTASGQEVPTRYNFFVPVATDEIKQYDLVRHAGDVQSNPYIVNIRDPAYSSTLTFDE